MSFIFDAINWKLKIMKKWLCKICFLWENKNRTVVIFLLVGLFVSLGFVYVLLVRNKRLNKENRLLQRQYEAVDNALFRMEEMQKTYRQYENMKKIYPNISLGTVYRNLSLLSAIGEIQKLSNFGSADHFDGCVEPHCHFMCTTCGDVLDLETEGMDDLIEKAGRNFSGKITACDIRFFGTCPKCMNK